MPGNAALETAPHASVNLLTRSGIAVTLRPAAPSDRPLLEDFFRHVSADDLRFRFLTTIRRVDDARIAELCTTPTRDAITFLAFDRTMLIAVATLAGAPDHGHAEVALTTRPEWKHQGVSWTLLEHLVRFARAQGYRELISIEKADNAGALGVERDMGFRLSLVDGDPGEVLARKLLPEG